jgi:hypothetical protein
LNCRVGDINIWSAWAPDAEELMALMDAVFLKYLNRCIMVKGPRVDYHSKNLFANAHKRMDVRRAHKTYVNQWKDEMVYYLILLPPGDADINPEAFFCDGKETDHDLTKTDHKKDDHKVNNAESEQVITITWYFGLGKGKHVESSKQKKSDKL